jgi:ubiquinone/menaquinone biosynthesis C-methylase UbiE
MSRSAAGPTAARTRRRAPSSYALPNRGKEAAARLAAFSALFDAGTVRHLEERGVGPGWRCLEVGGGTGTIAAWLAARVGPRGHVLVTDIDTRFLRPLRLPNLDVRRHDVTADALPEGSFDLVHARLVLHHLPEREQALARMISALKPGGWLLVEEYDRTSLLADPAVGPGEVLLDTQLALFRFLDERGVHGRYGRHLYARLRAHGLVSVGADAYMSMWHTGSPGAQALRASFEQLRVSLIAGHYVTSRQLEDDLARLDDPDFMLPSPILWSAWGRRP